MDFILISPAEDMFDPIHELDYNRNWQDQVAEIIIGCRKNTAIDLRTVAFVTIQEFQATLSAFSPYFGTYISLSLSPFTQAKTGIRKRKKKGFLLEETGLGEETHLSNYAVHTFLFTDLVSDNLSLLFSIHIIVND